MVVNIPNNPAALNVGQTFIGDTSIVTIIDLAEANQTLFTIEMNSHKDIYQLAAFSNSGLVVEKVAK